MNVHACARTTPSLRREIQQSNLPQRQLAKQYNVARTTIQKWKHRDSTEDRSHRPHRLQTSLTEAQEQIVVAVRKTLLLSLDDLVVVTREFLYDKASRAALHRCLKRHGVSNLRKMEKERQELTGTVPQKKTFKDYEPGYIHIDIKYLPQMADDSSRRYLLVAIDRATRWVYLEVVNHKSAANARAFLDRLITKAPFRINKILTDNGKEFTDRFCATGERKPTGKHLFDQGCAKENIKHRLIKPRKPQTNGMVERFNGRISEVLKTTCFDSSQNLKTLLERYLQIYNHQIPQKALGYRSPVQALHHWVINRPDLLNKSAVNHTKPDS